MKAQKPEQDSGRETMPGGAVSGAHLHIFWLAARYRQWGMQAKPSHAGAKKQDAESGETCLRRAGKNPEGRESESESPEGT